MKILGISCYYHDAAAALVVDDQVVAAAAEERFSRIKHDNTFPWHALNYCLHAAGLAINELDAVVFYEKPIIKFERMLQQHLHYFPRSHRVYHQSFSSWLHVKLKLGQLFQERLHYRGRLRFVTHHLAHAASAFYLSGFDQATVVTLDGVGEWATTTVGYGQGAALALDRQIHFPHSLGLLYSALTAYLGFSVNDAEYKVMGLAAYGNPATFQAQLDELVQLFPDGSYALNMAYFTFGWSERMYHHKLERLFGYPTRMPESPMEPHYQDIAAALQAKLEQVVFRLLQAEHRRRPQHNLCLAGGVALNSVMNGKLLTETPYRRLFIPPDPGDAGGAMGAALYLRFHPELIGRPQLAPMAGRRLAARFSQRFTPYLGPAYPWYQAIAAVEKAGIKYEVVSDRQQLLDTVAQLIADQAIIGWFQGRMEWGPRALGARSILASAATVAMRDIINEKVKHRELFRPFAPVILESATHRYFAADHPLPKSARYMLMVYPFKPRIGQRDVPAVVHVDGTGRLQTLRRADNPLYYDLIATYQQKTGVPIIINTSFNVRGEPIVCSPEDAVRCFQRTDIDVLVLDSIIVRKASVGSAAAPRRRPDRHAHRRPQTKRRSRV